MNQEIIEESNLDESENEVDEIISEQIIESGIVTKNNKTEFDKFKKFNLRNLERKIIIDSSDDELVKQREKNHDSDFIPEKKKRKRRRANELNDLLQNSQEFLNWPINKNKHKLVINDKEPIKVHINK
ncbi:10454_t:CDS:1, partial [Cetraspora pellucida]